jgi:genome maintenance exonuclease 1
MFDLQLLPQLDIRVDNTDNGRFYVTPEGNRYHSVTTALGKVSDTSWLQEWKDRVGEEEANRISKQAMAKGSALHELCEKYLLNDPKFKRDLIRAMPTTLGSFASVRPVLDRYVEGVLGIELPLYSDVLKAAGRTDAVVIYKKVNMVVDFKTTRSQEPKTESDIQNYFYQTTAYAMMVEERYGIKVPAIMIILTNGFGRPQIFVREKDKYKKRTMELFDAASKIN